MPRRACLLTSAALLASCFAESQSTIPLQVPAGAPLRLYMLKRTRYGVGKPIEAKLIDPVWAFDRIVIPAGAVAHGSIARLQPVSRMERAQAIFGGDFTPLKRAPVSFSSLTMPDGHTLTLHAAESIGLPIIYAPPKPRKPGKAKKNSKAQTALDLAKQQANAQINARMHGMYDLIRGRNRREWLEDFFWSKVPYHPQWYRTGTRIDAVLDQAMDFGSANVNADALQMVGSQPGADAVARLRVLSTVSSGEAKVGDPLEGTIAEPLFSADHKLILPEGTRLTGKITLARQAKYFHRGGRLRFTFDSVALPPQLETLLNIRAKPAETTQVQAQLAAAEADPGAVKVDQEGGAKATESKTRFLRPLVAGWVASRAMDNDVGKQTASGGGPSNTGGLSLGGFSGFGLFGIALAQGPRQIGVGLSYYGLAGSIYTNLIARGREVVFAKNTDMKVRFGTPARSKVAH